MSGNSGGSTGSGGSIVSGSGGNSTGSGGNVVSSTGGNAGTGGSTGTGGNTGNGGSIISGTGGSGTGGTTSTGGRATGGSGTGGRVGTGGTATGGTSTGGRVGTGGTSTGGRVGTGGSGTGGTSTGGRAGTGGSGTGGSSAVAGRCPASLTCPNNITCGCYVLAGLGANKMALLTAGASQYMLASAMMETERMDTNYALGDNKTGDSFNAGTCKQNWGMARICHPAWSGQAASAYSTMTAMNSSRTLDVQVYNECRSYYGDRWWGGHRNGSTGLNNSNTTDINNFKAAMDWTNTMLNGHTTDDVRFWVTIPAIILD